MNLGLPFQLYSLHAMPRWMESGFITSTTLATSFSSSFEEHYTKICNHLLSLCWAAIIGVISNHICCYRNLCTLICGMLFRQLIWLIFWTAHKSPISLHSSWLQWLVIYQSFPILKLAAPNNFRDLKLDIFIKSSLFISIRNLLCIATAYFNSWYQSIHSSLSMKCHFSHLQCWCHWWQTKVALIQILVILPTWVCSIFFPVLFTSWAVQHWICVHFICLHG